MARRSPGDGAIERAGNGWRAVIEMPPGPDGKRRRRKRRARTKTEATRLLRQMQVELQGSGGLGDGQRTVGEALDDYRKVRANKGLAASTIEHDQWMLSVIDGALGGRRLAGLTVQDVDGFLEAAAQGLLAATKGPRDPIGRSSLKRVRSTLVAALRNEMRLGLLNRNVADLSVLPAEIARPGDRRAITIEELHRLCEVATGSTGILVDLIGRNGLRPAEARAVRWANVDLAELLLTVDAQLTSKDRLSAPKTKKAHRTIRIDESTAAKIETHRAVQAKQRSYAGPAWTELDIVAAASSGRPIQRHNLRRAVAALCKRVGIEPTIAPYELRHTAISIQADGGHSAWQIADWAGTSERMIAEVYRHRLVAVSSLGPVTDAQRFR